MYSVSTPRLAPEKSASPLSVQMVNQTSSDYVVSLIQATVKDQKKSEVTAIKDADMNVPSQQQE